MYYTTHFHSLFVTPQFINFVIFHLFLKVFKRFLRDPNLQELSHVTETINLVGS